MSKVASPDGSLAAGTGRAVQSLVLETLDMLEAAVDVVDLGVYDVLLSGDEFRRITFDAEIAQERDDCELVTYGTPFLESMIEAAKIRGRLQVRQLESRAEPPQNLEDKVAKLAHFVKCKPPKINQTWTEEGFLLWCQFVVTFHGDEVVEALMTTLTDLQTLGDLTPFIPTLDVHWFTVGVGENGGHGADRDMEHPGLAHQGRGQVSTDHPYEGLQSVSVPYRLADGLAWAVNSLAPTIEQEMMKIRSENRTQLEDELGKSRHYYLTTLSKLEKQFYSTTDAEKKSRLKQKIEATKLDRDRRMEDISRAYEVTAEVHLDQAILYRVPMVCVRAHLQQRMAIFPYVFRYYPFASAWGPVLCEVCHEPTTRLERGEAFWHCGCTEGREL